MCQRDQTFVLLAAFLHHVAGNKVLKLLVSSEPKHFLSTACCITLLQTVVDDIKELLEFKGRSLLGKNCYQFLSDQIGESAGEGTFTLHNV